MKLDHQNTLLGHTPLKKEARTYSRAVDFWDIIIVASSSVHVKSKDIAKSNSSTPRKTAAPKKSGDYTGLGCFSCQSRHCKRGPTRKTFAVARKRDRSTGITAGSTAGCGSKPYPSAAAKSPPPHRRRLQSAAARLHSAA